MFVGIDVVVRSWVVWVDMGELIGYYFGFVYFLDCGLSGIGYCGM